MAAYSASGCLSGAASAKACIALHAASAFNSRGKIDDVDAEAPRIGELRHQAEIGDGRHLAEAERAGLVRRSASRKPSAPRGWPRPPIPSPCPRPRRARAAAPALSNSARDGYRRRSPARRRGPSPAATRSIGSSGGVGWVSSSHSMMASDCVSTPPSSSSSVGTSPCGLRAR